MMSTFTDPQSLLLTPLELWKTLKEENHLRQTTDECCLSDCFQNYFPNLDLLEFRI